eukprot:m.1228651 g.1228651  ORF g.1228651 m.1228651 type:complete len:560 (+) comp24648_c1_seq6:2-1681(+)
MDVDTLFAFNFTAPTTTAFRRHDPLRKRARTNSQNLPMNAGSIHVNVFSTLETNTARDSARSASHTIHIEQPDEDNVIGTAKALMFGLRVAEAVTILTNALAIPRTAVDTVMARHLLSEALLLLGQYAKASKHAKILLKNQTLPVQSLQNVQLRIANAKQAQARGLTAHATGEYAVALNHFTAALSIAKLSAFLRLMRADCAIALDNYALAKADTSAVLASHPRSSKALQLLAKAQFFLLAQPGAAVQNLRRCMRVGSDGVALCSNLFDLFSTIQAHNDTAFACLDRRDWSCAEVSFGAILDLEGRSSHSQSVYSSIARKQLCSIARVDVATTSAVLGTCGRAIADLDDKEDLQAQKGHDLFGKRAEALFVLGRYKDAKVDITRALRIAVGLSSAILQPLQVLNGNINNALRVRSVKDFYAVLGVLRTATRKEIKSAYHKMALLWHPDRNDSPDAYDIFQGIVEAYEVLMDDDLRAAYDRGEDISKRTQSQRHQNTFKTPEFFFNKADIQRDGTVKGWFMDPETGEKETVELKVAENQDKDTPPYARRDLPKHCCLESQ